MKTEIQILEKKLKKTREDKRLDKAAWKSESIDLNRSIDWLVKDLDEARAEKVKCKKQIAYLKSKVKEMTRLHAHDREILQDYIDAEYETSYN